MYTLYFSPGACSMAVHVILNELAVPFALENASIPDGKTRSPEFLKLNPRGQVPVLVEDGTSIKEGGAIILYLLDKHGSALLPESGLTRAKAMEWLAWCNASLHPAYSRAFGVKKYEDEKVREAVMAAALADIQKLWDEAEARLSAAKFLAGDSCTGADILMAVIANWTQYFPGLRLGPNVQRVLKDVTARPAYQKALKTEQVEYKAAA